MTRASAEFAVHGFEPGDPEPGGLVVLLGLLLLLALQVFVVCLGRLFAIAVMRLVVEDEDVLHPHQVGHDPLEHLALGLEGLQLLAGAALKQGAATRREFDALAKLECVVVGDDDLGPVDLVEHVAGNEFAAGVVAVRVVGLQDAEPVFDGQARCADQEAPREELASGTPDRVDRLPGDDHRHDGRLARAGGELQGKTDELRVGVLVRASRCSRSAFPVLKLGRDLGQPDGRLDGLDLAEKRADAAELVMSPVLEEAGGLRA